jgi:hypothetical protein
LLLVAARYNPPFVGYFAPQLAEQLVKRLGTLCGCHLVPLAKFNLCAKGGDTVAQLGTYGTLYRWGWLPFYKGFFKLLNGIRPRNILVRNVKPAPSGISGVQPGLRVIEPQRPAFVFNARSQFCQHSSLATTAGAKYFQNNTSWHPACVFPVSTYGKVEQCAAGAYRAPFKIPLVTNPHILPVYGLVYGGFHFCGRAGMY